MSIRTLIDRIGGRDHGADRYRYVSSEAHGPVSQSRAAQRWVRSTCGYCSVGCGMLLGVRDNTVVAVQGDPDHPVNHGRLCPKGLSEHHMITASGRLTTPTVDGQGVDWESAAAAVVDRFKATIERHGPESVAVLSTGQLVTEEFFALGKFVRLGMGLRHFDGNTTLCMASAVSGYKMSFGSDGPPACYEDLELADVVVLWGANIADNHPLLAPRLLGNQTIIAVDPRATKTAMIADHFVAVRPRGDIALLNGIMRWLLDHSFINVDEVRQRTEGFDELCRHLGGWSIERSAEESGISAEQLAEIARVIGEADRCVFAWTMGVNHSVQGAETVTLINSLALLTGNIGRPGTGPFSITGQCNAMGTREAGFTASMPGYRPYDDPVARAELAELFGISPDRLPTERGRAYPDIIHAITSRKIRALWIIGTNPVVSFPNRSTLEHALDQLDLLVVQDGFETPTTARADIVLPAAIWGEKDGTYTNSERRVSRVRAAVTPPGAAKSDFDIVILLAKHWGCADELFRGWQQPVDAFEEWRRVSAGRLCDYSGMTWDRIETAGGIQWPCPEGEEQARGRQRLYEDGIYPRPSGRALLRCVEPKPIRERIRSEFPLNLNTGRTVEHWHTRTKTGRIAILEGLAPEAWVEVHPTDAATRGVESGSWVRVWSSRGEIVRIRARVTSIVRAGEIFIPFHWQDQAANWLTTDEFDPISREPNFKQCAVNLEAV